MKTKIIAKRFLAPMVLAIATATAAMTLVGLDASIAAELNGVKAADEFTVDGKKLVLNGMGVRKVSKFGFPIKVYVGELYTEQKSKDSDAILKSDGVKVLIMHFLVSLDRNQLVEAFQVGLENGCYINCEKHSAQWGLISSNIVSMRQDNEIRFTFFKDKLEISSNGPNAKTAMLAAPAELAGALSHNLLSMFINSKKPPTEEFRKGLLGLE